MVEIEFDFNQQITVIQTKLDEPFKNAINKYLQKSLLDSNSVFFIANGRQINPEEKVENQISLSNKENKKVIILVKLIEKLTIVQEFAKSDNISICPQCYELCRTKTKNPHIFYFIFILSISFIEFIKNSEIKLIIKGKSYTNILNENFYLDPSNIKVNGESKDNCKKRCHFSEKLNNVTIIFDKPIQSCENMFYKMDKIIEINLSNFDASHVTNMNNMFSYCSKLEKITLGNIKTSLVKSMKRLFYNCSNLKKIDKLNFDTSSVTDMQEMFAHCKSLLSINAKFNPKNVENMFLMFAYCNNIEIINLPNFGETKTRNIQQMFYKNFNLKYIDLSNFELSPSVYNIRHAFIEWKSILFIRLNLFKINSKTDYEKNS